MNIQAMGNLERLRIQLLNEFETGETEADVVTPENRRETGETEIIRGGEAHRWRPGQSGNPGGRPRVGALAKACRAVLEKRVRHDPKKRTHAEMVADYLAEQAILGNKYAIRELADRAEGRAGQLLEVEVRRAGAEEAPQEET
jgi:hypothetical protein